MFGNLQGRERGSWECLGSSRRGKPAGREVENVWDLPGAGNSRQNLREGPFGNVWECGVTLGSLWESLLWQHPPCREHSLIFPVIQATALAPILVPKFRSKGVGLPP